MKGSGDFSGVNFAGFDLENAYLRTADLTGADLTDAVVKGASWGTWLTQEQLYSTRSYQSKDLQEIKFWYHDLTGWNLAGQNLSGASFRLADLTDANLSGANLADTDFSGSYLSLDGVYPTLLIRTDLSDAYLFGGKFEWVEMQDTNLARADARGTTYFSAPQGNRTDNMIWPDQTIRGLQLGAGETLKVRGTSLAEADHRDTVYVMDVMTIEEDATLELVLQEIEGESETFVSTPHHSVDSDVLVTLGGTLRLTGVVPSLGETLDLFDWPAPLEEGNVFSHLEVWPDTAWDLSQLYTTGEITLIPEPSPIGDYNGDGFVGQGDLDLVLLHWGDAAEPSPRRWISQLPSAHISQDELDAVFAPLG